MNSTFGIVVDNQVVNIVVENYTINFKGRILPGIFVEDHKGSLAHVFKESFKGPVLNTVLIDEDNMPDLSKEYMLNGYYCPEDDRIRKIISSMSTQLVKIVNTHWIDSENGYFDYIREFKKSNGKTDFLISIDKGAMLHVGFERWTAKYQF